MTSFRLGIAALIMAGLLAAPFAAEARKHRSSRYDNTGAVAVGSPTAQPRTYYGTSGQSVGTVTAPSIGTYSWPSVGVTNAVPTWSNTNPK